MAIVNVTNVIQTTEGYLTRGATVNALITQDTYVFPVEQDYLSIKNNGVNDLHFNVGKYENIVLHPNVTWSNTVDFTTFNIIAMIATTSFTYTTKEHDNTPVTISKLWELMALRDKATAGDIVLITAAAGSSAAAVNAAIAGVNKKFTRTVTVTLKNAAATVQTWFNGNFPIAVTKTGSGVVTIPNTYITLVDGVGTIDIA